MVSLYDDYFKYCSKWKEQYGEKTLVFIQVGKFFELYGLKDEDGNITVNDLEAIERISYLAIGDKKSKYDGKYLLQCGFTLPCSNKYISIFLENDYTIVLYTQDSPGKNTTRSLSEIISPGTYIEDEITSISNITLCIWLEYTKSRKQHPESLTIGVSSIDVFTGITTMSESTIKYDHSPNNYDQLEQLISVYNPRETIIISNLDYNIINEIKLYIGLDNRKCYIVEYTKESYLLANYVENSHKQNYQLASLIKYYPNISQEVIEQEILYVYGIALQSFVVLLDYMHEHNCDFIEKLYYPEFTHNKNKLIMANHSLKQLNIIDDNRHSGKLKSISNFLNNCITSMGKRKFLYELHNPITNVEKLNISYDITEELLNSNDLDYYRKNIKDIIDLDRFKRLIVMNRISPRKISKIHSNIKDIISIARYSKENNIVIHNNLLDSISVSNNIDNDPISNGIIINNILENTLNINICQEINDMSHENLCCLEIEQLYFIKTGKSENIDKLLREYSENLNLRLQIQKELSNIISSVENKKNENDYVKCSNSCKSDNELYATDRRTRLLINYISNLSTNCKVIKIDYTNNELVSKDFLLHLDEIKIKNKGSSKTDKIITSNQIKEIMCNIQKIKSKLAYELILYYNNFIGSLNQYLDSLDVVISYVANIDILQNKGYIANKYNYCRPIIDINSEKSYCSVNKLRHPLIEHLQQNELYVTNDLEIGINDFDGLLLYGTNAVGKTSFIRAIGIAVIMAQSGLFVPCSAFTYYPYDYIFTRILGNDNLFKGLSTFAVEMCELRTILNNSTQNSLIIGDELCSGTESSSALSIFTVGLQELHEKKSTFLFATHFHEIVNYEEIKELYRLKMMHMKVTYDNANDILIYDRKLSDGPGKSMYGLEVCRSLGLSENFLEKALALRKKYNFETNGILNNESSRYNKKKLKGICEICNINKGSEIHHLQFQSRADDNDYIEQFHKNHKANLINICNECHDNIHKNNTQYKLTKTTSGYILTELN